MSLRNDMKRQIFSLQHCVTKVSFVVQYEFRIIELYLQYFQVQHKNLISQHHNWSLASVIYLYIYIYIYLLVAMSAFAHHCITVHWRIKYD